MYTKDRFIFLFIIILSMIFFDINTLYAKKLTRNVTVQMNKPEIIWRHWIVNTQFDRTKVKCIVYRPPSMRVVRKPVFGKIKFKRGFVIENKLLSDASKKSCKGKVIKGTAVEFTGDKKGKVSFKVEVFNRQMGYEEYSYGTVLFNVNVR